jgi:hypothetical protein
VWRIRENSNVLDLLSCYRGSIWPSAVMLHKNMGTVKPLSSISVCFISCNYLLFLLLLKNFPCKLCVILLDISFLRVLFSHSSGSEFPVLTHTFQEWSFSREKNSVGNIRFLEHAVVPCISEVHCGSNVVFLECTVVLTYLN